VSDPASELVDLIDDTGNVIGVVTRQEMRLRRLPHRCVYLLVFDSRGRLFVHRRTAAKDVFPSYWDLCVGGVLASGESFNAGAHREGREELGVDLELHALFPFHFADPHTLVHGMVYHAVHDGPFILQPEEIETGEFVPIADLADRVACLKFCPDGLAVWREYQQSLASPLPPRNGQP
jgi:isopentenyldiphosphate isomerase